MIDDPIVIRKSRGLLVVSSSKPTDPIQLVREIAHDQLEVHLKNGTKYIEEIGEDDDIQEIILEMMGYGVIDVTFGFHAWPEGQEGTLEFYNNEDDARHLEYIGKHIVDKLYNATPYMNSKFLSLEICDVFETPNIKYYDGTYSQYDVEVNIQFRGRVDQVKLVEEEFESQGRDFASYFCKHRGKYDRMLHNERWFNVHVIE